MFPAEKIESDRHEIRSLDGRVRVPFKWLGDYPVTGDAGLAFIYPHGAKFPVVRRRESRAQSWTLEAVTVGADSTRLAGLLETGAPVGVYHAQAACHAVGCQIPAFQTVWVAAYPSQRSDIDRLARRAWKLELVPADVDAIGDVGGFQWADVAEKWTTWSGIRSNNSTWGTLAGRDVSNVR